MCVVATCWYASCWKRHPSFRESLLCQASIRCSAQVWYMQLRWCPLVVCEKCSGSLPIHSGLGIIILGGLALYICFVFAMLVSLVRDLDVCASITVLLHPCISICISVPCHTARQAGARWWLGRCLCVLEVYSEFALHTRTFFHLYVHMHVYLRTCSSWLLSNLRK